MFRFLELAEVDELHRESLSRFGGSAGTRDHGLLESALSSAINTARYADGDVFDVAATYAFHIARKPRHFSTATKGQQSHRRLLFSRSIIR